MTYRIREITGFGIVAEKYQIELETDLCYTVEIIEFIIHSYLFSFEITCM